MAMLNNQMVIFDNLLIISGWWCNNHLEKYDFVNGKDDIPYMKWKIKKCLKPPTSWSGFGWLWQLVKFNENNVLLHSFYKHHAFGWFWCWFSTMQLSRVGGAAKYGSVPKVRDPRVTMVEGMTWDMTGTMQWGCLIFQLIFKVKQSKLWFK